MRGLVLGVAVLASMALPTGAEAKGCIKGALVGGIAGHFAGHHGLLGAAAGCIAGRHLANRPPRGNARPLNTNGTTPAQ